MPNNVAAYERMRKSVNPYGDGKAYSCIVHSLNGEAVDMHEVYHQPTSPISKEPFRHILNSQIGIYHSSGDIRLKLTYYDYPDIEGRCLLGVSHNKQKGSILVTFSLF